MKRPAFQFYPADWRKDAALQSCSMAAQGLWINLMCVMHECEPYGHLSVNGKPMQGVQVARLVGMVPKECARLLSELSENGVSEERDGFVLSRRMVRDEHIRNVRAESGRLGGNPALVGAKVNQKDKQTGNQIPTPSSSSSSSASAIDKDPSDLPARLALAPAKPPAFDGNNGKDIPEKAIVPLSKAFDLSEEWGTDAEALGFPRSRILTESERFRQYWTAGKGAGKRKSRRGWRQSWSNWLGKAAERAA